MPFLAIGSAPKFTCLSTDVKPVTPAALSALGVEIGGVAVETDTGNRFIFDGTAWQPANKGAVAIPVADAEDISGGEEAAIGNYSAWTLYLKAAAAIDVTIELSPDGGTTWYEIEDTVDFAAAGDEIIEFGFMANRIRLTGSNANDVTAQVRGVF